MKGRFTELGSACSPFPNRKAFFYKLRSDSCSSRRAAEAGNLAFLDLVASLRPDPRRRQNQQRQQPWLRAAVIREAHAAAAGLGTRTLPGAPTTKTAAQNFLFRLPR